MNRIYLLIALSILASACETKERPDDDYVLIEFASKLEEDYEKIEKTSPNK